MDVVDTEDLIPYDSYFSILVFPFHKNDMLTISFFSFFSPLGKTGKRGATIIRLFSLGTTRRGVDLISTTGKDVNANLQSEHTSAIPCHFNTHHYEAGMLVGATNGIMLYVETILKNQSFFCYSMLELFFGCHALLMVDE